MDINGHEWRQKKNALMAAACGCMAVAGGGFSPRRGGTEKDCDASILPRIRRLKFRVKQEEAALIAKGAING